MYPPRDDFGFEPLVPPSIIPPRDNFGFEPLVPPAKSKPKESSGLDWWVEQALRTVPAVAGGLIGGATGFFGAGLGAIPGGMAGGATGSAVGNVLGNWYAGKEFNPYEFGVETVLGGVPPILGPAKFAGRGLGAIAKYAGKTAASGALEGGVVSAAGVPFQHWAQTGSFDAPMESYLQSGGAGALLGGMTGGAIGTYQGRNAARGLQAIGNTQPIQPPETVDLNVPPPATPPAAREVPAISKVWAKGNRWDDATKHYWGSRGYVPGGIDPDGRIFWVPGKQGVKEPPPTMTETPPVVQDTGGVKFNEDDGFVVPMEQMSPEVETNLEKDGYKVVGRDLKGGSIFKRFITDESGEFDPEKLWDNLRRLLGRDPTETELIEGMQRQGEGDEGAPPGSLIPPETLAKIPDDDMGIYGDSPREQAEGSRYEQEINELWEKARSLGINPEEYGSAGELADLVRHVEEGGQNPFKRDEDPFGPRPEIPPQDKWDQPVPGERGELQSFEMPEETRPLSLTNNGRFINDMQFTGNPELDAMIARMKEIANAPSMNNALWQELRELGSVVMRHPDIQPGLRQRYYTTNEGDTNYPKSSGQNIEVKQQPNSRTWGLYIDGELREGFFERGAAERAAENYRREIDPSHKTPQDLQWEEDIKGMDDAELQRRRAELVDREDYENPDIGPAIKAIDDEIASRSNIEARSVDQITDDLEEALNYGNGSQIPILIKELKSKIAGEFDIQRALNNRGMMGTMADNIDDPAQKAIFEDLHQAADNQYYQLVRDFQAGQPPVDPNQVYPPQTPMQRGWASSANEIWQRAIDLGINPDDYLLSDLYEAVRLREGGGPSPEQIYMELRRQWENVRQSPDSPEKQQLRRQLDAAYQDWKFPKSDEDTLSNLPPGHFNVGDTRFVDLSQAIQPSEPRPVDIPPTEAGAGPRDYNDVGRDYRRALREGGPGDPRLTDLRLEAEGMLLNETDPQIARENYDSLQSEYLFVATDRRIDPELVAFTKRLRDIAERRLRQIEGPSEAFDEGIPPEGEGGIDVSAMRQENVLGRIPGEEMRGPRGIADISIDQPMPPTMGQQEMPLGPHGELTPREGLPEDMIAGLQSPEQPSPFGVPEWAEPEPGNLPFTDELPPVGGGSGPKQEEKPSFLRELYDLSRGVTTILDLSASLRQGLPFAFNKQWRAAWMKQVAALKSEGAYQKSLADIKARDLFQSYFDFKTKRVVKSIAAEAGLRIMDVSGPKLNGREEGMAGKWIGKIPGARASNRAYTAFLNQLRADTFESLFKDAEALFKAGAAGAKDPRTDKLFAKEIADFVNTATGRGPLKTALPYHTTEKGWHLADYSLERNAKLLTDVLFSPRLIASRLRMLNPATYAMGSPFVRKQYAKAALTTAGMWITMATVAKMGGAEVSLDTNSSDFGKIKIGNVRLDPGGGFQQFLVAASRLFTGMTTSSATQRQSELGQGYRAETRKDVLERVVSNKLHPVLKFAYDLLDASERTPFNVADRTAQLFVPLIVQDTLELVKEGDPRLLALLGPVALGMGTQTYEKGETRSKIIPKSFDWSIEGGKPYNPFEATNPYQR